MAFARIAVSARNPFRRLQPANLGANVHYSRRAWRAALVAHTARTMSFVTSGAPLGNVARNAVGTATSVMIPSLDVSIGAWSSYVASGRIVMGVRYAWMSWNNPFNLPTPPLAATVERMTGSNRQSRVTANAFRIG